MLAMLLVIGATVGGIVGWLVSGPAEPDARAIELVAQEQMADAIPTLTQSAQQIAQSDRRQCSFPMAFITVSTPGNPAGGTVTFRTSKYRSPTFRVTDQPQRIAIPNPLPDSGGLDLLTAEGNASGLLVSLYPTARMEPINGSSTVTVRWRPRPPCK